MPDTSSTPGSNAPVRAASASLPSAKKIVIAVHGIGDQYHNATIQSVVSSFGKFADYTASMPLGRLDTQGGKKVFILTGPPKPEPDLDTVAFVEIYWADIPREVQTEGYRIEETKAWARTVVERLRARYNLFRAEAEVRLREGALDDKETKALFLLHREDFFAAADAIDEMIETFAVLDHLLSIAEKAGLLKFDLNNLLTSYVGDVQIVADFADQRRMILDHFSKILFEVTKENKKAEIYVISHSEGTVIAFMGLLEAMANPARENGAVAVAPPAWVSQLRGFMTIGSPIDKHLILWPDIWDDLQQPHANLESLVEKGQIKWRNYYDYGDPVGFKLDTTQDWLTDHGWKPFFEFDPKKHDYGFGRYLFPGAAHNDYWKDDEVFGHFIETVVGLEPKGSRTFAKRPGSKFWPRLGSWIIPYLLVYLLLFAGVYLVYKGSVEYFFNAGKDTEQHVRDIRKATPANVAGISALMMGMIALARIPRLTRRRIWWFYAALAFAAGAGIYLRAVQPEIKNWHTLGLLSSSSEWVQGEAVIGCAFLVIVLAVGASRLKLWKWTKPPRSWFRHFLVGTRPLMIPGAICVLGAVAIHVVKDKTEASLWPLLLVSAAFFYLWWLAILVFDLVFVWHRYIRSAASQTYLTKLRSTAKRKPESEQLAGAS